jgi:hypothetical protein
LTEFEFSHRRVYCKALALWISIPSGRKLVDFWQCKKCQRDIYNWLTNSFGRNIYPLSKKTNSLGDGYSISRARLLPISRCLEMLYLLTVSTAARQ